MLLSSAGKGTRRGAVVMDMPLSFIIIVVVVAIILIAATTGNRRRADAQSRLCPSCGCTHPPFAQFCPRCGKQV
jgi:hypothetical protein